MLQTETMLNLHLQSQSEQVRVLVYCGAVPWTWEARNALVDEAQRAPRQYSIDSSLETT